MVNARPRASSASYLESLPFLIGPIFDQVQNTVANHRKNLVSLRNIQEQCSGITADGPKGLRAIGEKAFNAAFIDMVNRILPVKKGVAVADRAVKFVASYVAYTTEQGQLKCELNEWMLIGRPGIWAGRCGSPKYNLYAIRIQALTPSTLRNGSKGQECQIQSHTFDCIDGERIRRDEVRTLYEQD